MPYYVVSDNGDFGSDVEEYPTWEDLLRGLRADLDAGGTLERIDFIIRGEEIESLTLEQVLQGTVCPSPKGELNDVQAA